MKSTLTICAILCLFTSSTTAQIPSAQKEAVINDFAVEDRMTLDVFRDLAKTVHVTVGVSGELIGGDNKRISIRATQSPLSSVLNQICLKDPRYKWHKLPDGNIEIIAGKEKLGLLDSMIADLTLSRLDSRDALMTISGIPEVKSWAGQTHCRIEQVFVAGAHTETWLLNIQAKNRPLWGNLE